MSCLETILGDRFCPAPGITILVMKISGILKQILPGIVPPDYRGKRNRNFTQTDFSTPLFSEQELEALNRFKALKKQVEWISGRVALKTLVKEVVQPDLTMKELDVSYREKGAPFLTRLPHVPVSLSHSGNLTAAVLAENPGLSMGIDLEGIGPFPEPGFMKTAFTQKEIRGMGNRAEDVFRNWTLKEAFLKYIRMGFNESLHQVEIIDGQVFHRGTPQDTRTWSRILEDGYVLSLVWR